MPLMADPGTSEGPDLMSDLASNRRLYLVFHDRLPAEASIAAPVPNPAHLQLEGGLE